MFLNNVSLGVYRDAVRRPGYRDAKVRTLLETAEEVLGPSAQAPELRLVDDALAARAVTSPSRVSNDPYAPERPVARGTRPALDTGQLGIVILDVPGDSPLPPKRAWCAPHFEVHAPHRCTPGLMASRWI
jgi:hypothetical protein